MTNGLRKYILLWIFSSLLAGLNAAVKLPVLVSDGMVLQRDQTLTVWGWADAGEQVDLRFLKKKYQTVADSRGNWKIELPAMKAGGPYSMQINGIEINNILLGDVWLCSGQSNMELPIRRVMEKYEAEVLSYQNPMIRHIKVPLIYDFNAERKDLEPTAWKPLDPQNALDFSAVAYFFAKDLYAKTHVPIGLIHASVGGSPAEAWISESGLKAFPTYLNERAMCQDESYVEAIRQRDRKNRQTWMHILNQNDSGLSDKIRWNATDYPDTAWRDVDLMDTDWGTDGLIPMNGSHWFRKEIQLPEHLNGAKAVLRLGCIVDADSVFVNDTFVGTVSYQYPPRIYQIPEGLLQAGTNKIAIRLISYSGFPHFVQDKPYQLNFESDTIRLTGNWKYKLGTRMPALPGETFFHYKPTGLYQGMIAPLIPWGLKGVLWYQGESNTGKYHEYYELMTALIEDWRGAWKRDDLPFLMVQLANFMQDPDCPSESNWAALRQVQYQLSRTVPNIGLAVTIDIGEWNDIHPLNKKDLGKRLSLQAQKIAYGYQSVIADGPILNHLSIENNTITLSFQTGTDDLMAVEKLKGFSVAGKDGIYHWVEAKVTGNQVVIDCKGIEYPQSLRYAWGNNPQTANLKNKAGLPASPFEVPIQHVSVQEYK